jgi:hypothetical protein
LNEVVIHDGQMLASQEQLITCLMQLGIEQKNTNKQLLNQGNSVPLSAVVTVWYPINLLHTIIIAPAGPMKRHNLTTFQNHFV